LLAFKNGELLTKGEVFEHQTAARPKQAKHGSEPEPKQGKHGNQVIADRLCRLPCEVVDFTAGQDCDEGQILASYLYQVHLYQWLEKNGFGSCLTDGDL
jgi:hypothetical protein